ncbi:peptidylprolyl isomerase [Seohaeicola sp. SP36]|uniref:peptidylprolyl isomerase n=1 Tax=unclassified Seohaeicola TaxID=2641111 RepID=UPI00237A4C25|nr:MULTISPECIES: peptidylprolyl isomerase [unclassified Seohaeicola]MDD9706044.1 peptidylprolyl isomerase [Seohaeicola sp. 4SK31]MDD9734503.1 peptidylprolyl isomerase [Seohaeicola sp. SP36]
MIQKTRPVLFALLALLGVLAQPLSTQAQGLFAPVATVDDQVVTRYEVEQRIALLRVLRAQGNLEELARQQLIEDRVKMAAARSAGIEITDEAIMEGMTEFASRADLSREEFLRALGGAGVAEQTFRDFIIAALGWRDLVRARFVPRVRITDADVDKALSVLTGGSTVRVLLSEIILAAPPQQAAAAQELAEDLSQITSIDQFSAEARRVSATQTRENGGRLDWMPITNLPEQLRPVILGLSVGEVTQPIPLDGAIALFQLRGIQETGVSTPEFSAIDYAAYYLAGGRTEANLAEAARIRASVDTCNDLYGLAKGQPPELLERNAAAPADLPRDIALELAKLDRGEISANLTRPAADGSEALMVLMLCGRTAAGAENASREQITAQLRNQRLEAYARGYLAQLVSDARIVEQ